MDLFDAEILAKQLISEHVPYYGFAWDNRKTYNGLCDYASMTIYLSRHLTRLRTPENVCNTIMHEIAHALTPGSGHGLLWKQRMRLFGLKPERCSTDKVDLSGISNWKATCSFCGVTAYMIRRPRLERSCKCGGNTYNEKYSLKFIPNK